MVECCMLYAFQSDIVAYGFLLVVLPAFGLVTLVAGVRLFYWEPRRRRSVGEVLLIDGCSAVVDSNPSEGGARRTVYRTLASNGHRVPLMRVWGGEARLWQSVLGLVLTVLGLSLLGFGISAWLQFLDRGERVGQSAQG